MVLAHFISLFLLRTHRPSPLKLMSRLINSSKRRKKIKRPLFLFLAMIGREARARGFLYVSQESAVIKTPLPLQRILRARAVINWTRSRDISSRYVEPPTEFIVAHGLIYQVGSDLSVCSRRARSNARRSTRDSEADWPISPARHFERTGIAGAAMRSVCGIRQTRRLSLHLYPSGI